MHRQWRLYHTIVPKITTVMDGKRHMERLQQPLQGPIVALVYGIIHQSTEYLRVDTLALHTYHSLQRLSTPDTARPPSRRMRADAPKACRMRCTVRDFLVGVIS